MCIFRLISLSTGSDLFESQRNSFCYYFYTKPVTKLDLRREIVKVNSYIYYHFYSKLVFSEDF